MGKMAAYQGTGKYIFVSYSHADELKVLPIIKALQSKYNVWFDNDIEWGEEYNIAIINHINECSLFMFMVSSNALKSDYCKKEIKQATRKAKPAIYVVIEDCLNTEEADAFLFHYGDQEMCLLYQMNLSDFINSLDQKVPAILEAKVDVKKSRIFSFLESNVPDDEIEEETKIRISYAGIVVFKYDNRYLLVTNTHGLGLYQLTARTYRLDIQKREEFINKFHASLDDYVREEGLCDYRLLIPAKKLEDFYKAFLDEVDPQTYDYSDIVDNVVERCGLDKKAFKNAKTSFIKRIIKPIEFSRYTNHYEMILSDISVFKPNEAQLNELKRISSINNDEYRFATIKEIKANGVDIEKGKRRADITPIVYDILSNTFKEEDL